VLQAEDGGYVVLGVGQRKAGGRKRKKVFKPTTYGSHSLESSTPERSTPQCVRAYARVGDAPPVEDGGFALFVDKNGREL
jgi:hypothetical protein